MDRHPFMMSTLRGRDMENGRHFWIGGGGLCAKVKMFTNIWLQYILRYVRTYKSAKSLGQVFRKF